MLSLGSINFSLFGVIAVWGHRWGHCSFYGILCLSEEISEELQARKVLRGNIAQIKNQENTMYKAFMCSCNNREVVGTKNRASNREISEPHLSCEQGNL